MNHLVYNLYLIFIPFPARFPCFLHQSGNSVKEAFHMALVLAKEQRQRGKSRKIQPVVKEDTMMKISSVDFVFYSHWSLLSKRHALWRKASN